MRAWIASMILLALIMGGCAEEQYVNSSVGSDVPKQIGRADNSIVMLAVSSDAFEHNGLIPKEYTCDGPDYNPRLVVRGIPAATESLVLIVDDPDAPSGDWVHWVLFDINPGDEDELVIEANSVPSGTKQGRNSWSEANWGGPCPPVGDGEHRYFFRVYALDTVMDLESTHKQGLLNAIQGHIIGKAELVGLYSRAD